MVKNQRKIEFINNCCAVVDYDELEKAILWYSCKPTISKKHIFMYGNYPAVSIGKDKIHIHRLMMMYWLDCKITREFLVQHIYENKLDCRKENLEVVLDSSKISKNGKGKTVSDKVRNRMIAYNHTRKGTRQPFHREDISYLDIKKMLDKGYSLNKIAKTLRCGWSTVKARVEDLKNNPELLEREG